MDDWNPMLDHYSSETNSYETGPGSKLPKEYQPWNHKQNGRINNLKLHVTNLPDNFDEDSMRNIFSKYGIIKDLFISSNRLFSGVTYEEQSSAHQAMTALSDDPLYKFKISYFIEKEKAAPDNMQKKNQPYHVINRSEEFNRGLYNTMNNHPKSQFFGVNSENHSFYLRHQSISFTGDHINSSMSTPHRSSTSQSQGPSLNPLPNCKNCGVRTVEQCIKCREYYCSKKCMLMGFQYHTDTCITIAPHTTDPNWKETLNNGKNSAVVFAAPPKNVSRLNQFQPNEAMDEFHQNAEDYRRYKTTNLSNHIESLSISNSYDNDDVIKQNSHHNDDFVSKKPNYTTSDNFTGGINTTNFTEKANRSSYQKNTDEFRRKNHNDALGSENQVPKTNTRIRNGGYENQSRNESRIRNDRPYITQNSKRHDNSKNDENRSDEIRQKRSYDTNNSKYENSKRMDSSRGEHRIDECRQRRSFDSNSSKYGPRNEHKNQDDVPKNENQNDEYRPKKSSERSDSRSLIDDEQLIAFSDSPPKIVEKMKPVDGLNEKPDSRGRSNDYARDEKRDKQQSNYESRSDPEYITNRKSFNEGNELEVRLNEITSDPSEYSSVRIVEEERLFPMLLADMMKETSLPPVSLKANTKCLVCHDHERVRAMIVSENPLRVKYIDSGYRVHDCEEKNVRGCPEKYAALRPFAYKVKFCNAEKVDLDRLKNENEIFKIVIKKKIKEFIWEVEIVASDFNERLQEARQTRDTRNSLVSNNVKKDVTPKLVEKLVLQPQVPLKVLVTFIEENEEVFYIARYEDIQKVAEEVEKHATACPQLEKIEVDKSCLTFVEADNSWYRARIIDTNPLRVYFTDFGNTDDVDKKNLKEEPMVCQSVPSLAIKVKLVEGKPSEYGIAENGFYRLKPIKKYVEEKLWTVVLEDSFEVTVCHKVSQNEYYVIKPSDTMVMEEIAQLPFIPLKSPPKVGALYLCEYEDYNCRAQLTNASPSTVKFVDYGNEEEVSFDRLGELPIEWQRRDPLAFKISILPEFTEPPLELYSAIVIQEKENDKWMVVRRQQPKGC